MMGNYVISKKTRFREEEECKSLPSNSIKQHRMESVILRERRKKRSYDYGLTFMESTDIYVCIPFCKLVK